MTSPEQILDMNIARYRELIRTEQDVQFRAKLEEALARDLEAKRSLEESAQTGGLAGCAHDDEAHQ